MACDSGAGVFPAPRATRGPRAVRGVAAPARVSGGTGAARPIPPVRRRSAAGASRHGPSDAPGEGSRVPDVTRARRWDSRRLDPRRWSLWSAPTRVVVAVLVVDLA